jgi:molybdopterin converting factor small subunit
MAIVHLPSGLRRFAGGAEVVTIDAPRVHELLARLGEQFPAMADSLDEIAVAIDGVVYQQPGYQPLGADSEVHLVPRIAGG